MALLPPSPRPSRRAARDAGPVSPAVTRPLDVTGPLDVTEPRILRAGSALIALLVLGHVVSILLRFGEIDVEGATTLSHLLSMDGEGNLPTMLSASLLLLCTGVALLCGSAATGVLRRGWRICAVILLLVAISEGGQLHEAVLGQAVESFEGAGRALYAGLALVGITGSLLAVRRFARALDRRVRIALVAAAAAFLAGAAGVEAFGHVLREVTGTSETWAYQLLVAVEESLELLGGVLFLRGAVRWLGTAVGTATVRFGAAAAGGGAPTAEGERADTDEGVDADEGAAARRDTVTRRRS